MERTERRERFRALLSGRACINPGSVFDPMSARIAEDLGFEVGMFAGSVASLVVLGAPDLIVVSLSEFAEQAHRICRAGRLPLLVDADHGYGNALNVRRTVEELETAGVAALTIEDTVLPRPFGDAELRLVALDEGVGKMRAAVSARDDARLVVVGRTSAMAVEGVAGTVARARAYAAAGVDAIFLVGVRTREQLDALAAEVNLPLMLGTLTAELADRDYLASRGVRIALQGHQPLIAAVRAVHETLKALREGVAPADLPNIASAELMQRVTRAGDYDAWTREFLGG